MSLLGEEDFTWARLRGYLVEEPIPAPRTSRPHVAALTDYDEASRSRTRPTRSNCFSGRSVATRAAHPAQSRLKARTHFGHKSDTWSGARGVRLSVCLDAEVAVDTADHHFYPY